MKKKKKGGGRGEINEQGKLTKEKEDEKLRKGRLKGRIRKRKR